MAALPAHGYSALIGRERKANLDTINYNLRGGLTYMGGVLV